ncbi:leucyl aminopeptidase [soil metagenome]
MDFRTRISPLDQLPQFAADALLLVVSAVAAGDGEPEFVNRLPEPLHGLVAAAIASGDLKFKAGRTLYLHAPIGVAAPRVLVAVASGSTVKQFKSAVSNGLGPLKNLSVKHVAVAYVGPDELSGQHAEALVCAASDSLYVFRESKPSAPAPSTIDKITLLCEKSQGDVLARGMARGEAVAAGVALARQCANLPGNYCTPTYLASQAKKLGKSHGLKVDVLDRKDCEKLGMGSFLAVAQGSEQPLKFIVARYEGAPKSQAPIVLVGKGITFDSGGVSIKPAGDMDEMKFDMGGAASVLGTLRAVAEMKPKLNLVVIIPSCENMINGRAVKPGDVVTSMSGQTIEVLNTDAEGRLILCDALTYAERFKPAVVIDVATLTGACVVALGNHRSGLFSEDEALVQALMTASLESLDLCWRMPLDEEYDEGLRSNFADMGNVAGRAGGAITAAMFLRRFTSKFRWAHLDIAGTAWKSGGAKGSTGRPVPLLTHFVLSQAAADGVVPLAPVAKAGALNASQNASAAQLAFAAVVATPTSSATLQAASQPELQAVIDGNAPAKPLNRPRAASKKAAPRRAAARAPTGSR